MHIYFNIKAVKLKEAKFGIPLKVRKGFVYAEEYDGIRTRRIFGRQLYNCSRDKEHKS